LTFQQNIKQSITKGRGLHLLKISVTLLICGIAVWYIKNYFSSNEVKTIIKTSFKEQEYLVVFMLLMSFINWGTESIKWMIALPKNSRITFLESFRSILIGLGMSLLMPRLAGESIGRYTSHQGNKTNIVSALVLTKIFQTLITLIFGLFGVLYFEPNLVAWVQIPHRGVLIIVFISCLLLYIFRKKIKQFVISNPYFDSFRQMTIAKGSWLAFFSTIRYLSFFGQFYIMCLFIDIDVNLPDLFFALATLYLLRMVTISINAVVDLGVRFATAILVFSTLDIIPDTNSVIVVFSLVWLFNVIIPSLSGGLLILKNR
jgi:hypothetical protein